MCNKGVFFITKFVLHLRNYCFLFCQLLFFILLFNICEAQKPTIDFSTVENWPLITRSNISNDGNFISYWVKSGNAETCILSSSKNNFKKEFPGLRSGHLTADSHYFISLSAKDTLWILNLETKNNIYIPNCKSFKTPEAADSNWLAYQQIDNHIIVYNLVNGAKRLLPMASDYIFNKTGSVLLLIKPQNDTAHNNKSEIHWFDLLKNYNSKIWNGESPTSFTFDQSQSQLAFIANNEKSERAIWCYQTGMDNAHELVSPSSLLLNGSFEIRASKLQFNPNGDRIFFNVYKKSSNKKLSPHGASVDVWRFNDRFLPPAQLSMEARKNDRPYKVVIHKNTNEVVMLENEDDQISYSSNLNEGGNDNLFLVQNKVNSWEGYYIPNEKPDTYLVNTKDGSRKCIIPKLDIQPFFSPGGKFVIWYDGQKRAYFTYSIEKGIITNITAHVSCPIYQENWDVATKPLSYGVAAWLQNDEAVLIYDRYDIWQIDPSGIESPINVTNGYGRKNKIILRYAWANKQETSINKMDTSLVCGFNERNKQNGFFKVYLKKIGDPICLIMSSHAYYFPEAFGFVNFPSYLKKAKRGDIYLLTRMDACNFPNLYITNDFKTFSSVTNLAPEKQHNWLTSELIRWKAYDGRTAQGILYKPEDFNPQKKYPIIFYVYESFSAGLNLFINPELSWGAINIPFLVSRGYLVLCPDIRYTIGDPGVSAYKYVVSAANMIRRKPWVDPNRMGIQGHSFGGYEVNYLVTRTKLFTAAASAAGLSDLVSSAMSFLGELTGYTHVELGQLRMGTTFWQTPKNYIVNSPFFYANKVVTPLLIMHNKNDGGVLWQQSLGFFSALRRLKKRAWLLQYDNGNHELSDFEDKYDYTMRLMQFFDHYLKRTPAPSWMLYGINASQKRLTDGFELINKKDPKTGQWISPSEDRRVIE
jgi:dienelactone hydrolase